MRYELVDGQLLVTPAPLPIHQRVVVQLTVRLEASCPEEFEVFVAPFDFRPASGRSLQPDVLVCRCEDVGPKGVERRPLLLAVEVLSSSTRMTDLLLKRAVYEEAGVGSYWLIDPDQEALTRARVGARSVCRAGCGQGRRGVRGAASVRGSGGARRAGTTGQPFRRVISWGLVGRFSGRTMSPVRT
ncbi:Uma2 family endonuclease [Kribbella sp. CA-294648]|uniref:Uma2 family endonuclease n=1 Tax=Kribbella sp. CA-294648 TaxID=3239948 RepID=UPI003D94F62D